MKKIIIASFILLPLSGFSQGSELGIFGGGSYYHGELNPDKPFWLTKSAYGLVYRYNFNPRYAFKANILRGTIEGNDAQSSNLFRKQRNLSFQSIIYEASAQIEFNFLPYAIGERTMFFSPYAFVGVGAFKFNPKAELDGTWHSLQPLGTEAQGTAFSSKKRYSLIQFAMPFGLGAKLNLTRKFGLALEWGLRKTSTDYIDDVSTIYYDREVLTATNGPLAARLADRRLESPDGGYAHPHYQRGNVKNKDWYSFAGIMLMYSLRGREKCPLSPPD